MQNKVDLKQWHLYLGIVLLLLGILSPAAAMVTWKAEIENSVKKVSDDLESHKIDPDVHMRLKEKIEFFVTRDEWKTRADERDGRLAIIQNDIKQILQRLK